MEERGRAGADGVVFEPGPGVLVVGPAALLFIPAPDDHPLIDELVKLVHSLSEVPERAVRAVFRSDTEPLPTFVLVAPGLTWRVIGRGGCPVEATFGGESARYDPSRFGILMEQELPAVPDSLVVGEPPAHGLFTVSGVGVLPAAGFLLGDAPPAVAPSLAGHDGAAYFVRGRQRHDGGGPMVGALPDEQIPWNDDAGSQDLAAASVDSTEWPGLIERSDGDESGDAGLVGGPLTDLAELFGVRAESENEDRAVRVEPVEAQSAEADPAGSSQPAEAVEASAPALEHTNHHLRTEIDRLRDEFQVGRARAGEPTTSAAASLVRGRPCPAGHLNELTDAVCRQCGVPIAFDAATTTGPRPRLGHLEFDNGEIVNLDRPVVIGRSPQTDYIANGETALPVPVTDIDMRVSSTHVVVYFDGWNVVIANPGSTNSTWLIDSGGQRSELRAGSPARIRPGTRVTMADRRSFTFLVP